MFSFGVADIAILFTALFQLTLGTQIDIHFVYSCGTNLQQKSSHGTLQIK